MKDPDLVEILQRGGGERRGEEVMTLRIRITPAFHSGLV